MNDSIHDLIAPPFVLLDGERKASGWNPAALWLLGGTSGNGSVGAFEGLRETFAAVDGPFSMTLPSPDGERFYQAQAFWPEGDAPTLLLTFQDQTERVHLHRRLREAENQLRAIGEATLDAVFIMDGRGRIRYVNAAAERIFGWPVDYLRGRDLHEVLVPPEDAERYRSAGEETGAARSLLQPRFGEVHELPAVRQDGRRIEIELSLSAFPALEGRAALGVVRDVTERRARERNLREAEARWQYALEGGGDGVWDWNIVTGHIFFGPRFKSMLGYQEQEFEDSIDAWKSNIHPDDLARVQRQLAACVEGRSGTYTSDFRMRTAAGAYMWVQDRGAVVERDAEGRATRMVGTQRDITEARQATEALQRQLAETMRLNSELEAAQVQLVQSEKLAAIGQLSAGVAHEMNTPLGFVSSNFSSLERYTRSLLDVIRAYHEACAELGHTSPAIAAARRRFEEADVPYLIEDMPALFAETRDGIERVRKIVADLRDFSRVGEQDWQYADLRQGLDSTLNILHNQFKHNVQVVRDYQEIPAIWCIPSQLNQVFLNLLVNALHAIDGAGTITVRTSADPHNVRVCVEDDGCGIALEEQKRIFTPFYTTKPSGSGTGLGLSLSEEIVARHNGRISVVSAPGQGSAFIVELPLLTMPE